ncbi:hypothetical protein RhiirA1_510899 [Rhizophagus irregularis]|uniref:Uncharacterized protein n=1 Tax=Rhizophagus irregularis TaxID=588596 RepID=A0A2N0QQR9_9GLOM|nr:hypothetical protein RhiirA1_510899 [Rhizophagus irregularis]
MTSFLILRPMTDMKEENFQVLVWKTKVVKKLEVTELINEKVDMYLQKVCEAEVIKKDDEIWTSREYVLRKDGKHSKKWVNNGCKVTEITNGKLTAILVSYDKELKEIFSLNILEECCLINLA